MRLEAFAPREDFFVKAFHVEQFELVVHSEQSAYSFDRAERVEGAQRLLLLNFGLRFVVGSDRVAPDTGPDVSQKGTAYAHLGIPVFRESFACLKDNVWPELVSRGVKRVWGAFTVFVLHSASEFIDGVLVHDV